MAVGATGVLPHGTSQNYYFTTVRAVLTKVLFYNCKGNSNKSARVC